MNVRVEALLNSIHDDEAVFISSYPNIFYYSAFTSEDAFLLISHNESYIITDSRYTIQAKEQSGEFTLYDIKDGFEKLFSKIPEKIIGYEENNLSVKQYKELKRKIVKEFTPMQKNIERQRRIKDSLEIKRIAEAQKIGDEAFSYILNHIRAGKTEREIALDLEFFMKRQGATALSFETIAASGKRSAMPHGIATDKVIEKGDFLTLDFGCIYEGYCSDMTRTVVIGKPTDKQTEIYNIVLSAQNAGLLAIEEGKKCSDADAAARKVIEASGYGENFGHGLGHGVGIEIHEMPSLSPKCDDIIKNGNILTVEPGIYIEDFGGVRIEDLVVVEDGKMRNLTNSAKELIIIQ